MQVYSFPICHSPYATHRIGSTEAASKILLNAQPRFPKEGIIYYNLACYDCQLGEIENAKNHLKKAFEIDPNWRLQALEDQDLKPLWDSLRQRLSGLLVEFLLDLIMRRLYATASDHHKCLIIKEAEGVRFELTRPFGLPVFKTGAINRSATPP